MRAGVLVLFMLVACSDSSEGGGGAGGDVGIGSFCAQFTGPADAGADQCLSCLVSQCCEYGHQVQHCLVYRGREGTFVQPCYASVFAAVRECFADAVASGSPLDSEQIALDCSERVDADSGPQTTAVRYVQTLTECVVGVHHGDAGLVPNDAGVGSRCVDECLPEWR